MLPLFIHFEQISFFIIIIPARISISEFQPDREKSANDIWDFGPGDILDELLIDISWKLVITEIVAYDVVCSELAAFCVELVLFVHFKYLWLLGRCDILIWVEPRIILILEFKGKLILNISTLRRNLKKHILKAFILLKYFKHIWSQLFDADIEFI